MSIRACIECNSVFNARAHYQIRCYPCWKRYKGIDGGHQHSVLHGKIEYLERQVNELSRLKTDLHEKLPRLLQLCHPDRHGNSETATRITQWLLGLRENRKSISR